MDCGKVLYAVHDGTWVLRLNGDVRATWCSSLDALLDRLFADPALRGIVLDLRETTNIDSTMLGVLARIGMRSRDRLAMRPLLLGPNADVRRLLDSMCLEKVLEIVDDQASILRLCNQAAGETVTEVPAVERTDDEVCAQVTGAHRALMDLDERNRAAFHSVVTTLEEQQRANSR